MKKIALIPSLIIGLGLSLLTGCEAQETHPDRVVTKFLNYDETVLYVNTIPYGNDAVYQGTEPKRESSVSTVYTFSGWDKPLTSILEDTTFYAQYLSETRKYEIKFVNYDQTVLDTQNLDYGSTPTYAGPQATREPDAQYTYAFSGWSPEIGQVNGDATYVAQYSTTINSYTITWNVDGVETQETYEYGQTPSFKGDTSKESTAQYSYGFKGWLPEISQVTGDITYVAQYESSVNHYTITWNIDGTTTTEDYEYGQTPSFKGSTDKNPDAEWSYTFSGWSPEIKEVTGDATYSAQYDKTKNKYTVTWNVDGNTSTEQYEYGETPSFKGTPSKESSAQYTYTFSKWEPDITQVTEDITYTAKFNSEVNSYTVTWENYDGTVLKTDTLEYGQTPSYVGETPTKEKDAQYSYTFSGWSPEIKAVTGNATYVAQFNNVLNQYTITWNIEGEETHEIYNYGDTPSYSGETPTKEKDAQYSYTFSGWSPEITTVKADATYTAQFDNSVNKYTITWQNYDGTVLATDEVEYGKVPSYGGIDPTKEGNAQYTYTFSGWSPTITAVDGNKTYTAQFTATVNKYSVTWLNYDGTVLETDNEVEYGATPRYDGETPTKEGNAQYSYTFTGWSPSIASVTGNATYTAQFSSATNQYTVTWVVNGKETVETYEYGATPSFKGSTDRASTAQYTYTFTGWSPTITTVTGNARYVAQYSETINQYTINWKNYDGTLLLSEKVNYGTMPSYTGSTPTKTGDAQYSYSFIGWSPEVVSVTENATYFAQFSSSVNKYTVVWKNNDGSILETDSNVPYGQTPSYDGETPTRAASAQYTYTFSGWSPVISAVTGDAVYTAQYNNTVNSYTITWSVDGVNTQEQYNYGATPSFKGSTVKASDAQYAYTFTGWSPAITTVTGNATYTAQYSRTLRQYTVTWIVDGNETTDTYYYGETPSFGGNTDKESDYDYNYTFIGWSPSIDQVTGNVTYTAQYETSVNYDSKYVFELRENEYAVTGLVDESLTEFNIPASYNGLPVTEIADNAFNKTEDPYTYPVVSVTLPNTIKRIGEHAFNQCASLENINLPSGLETIGDFAFQNCHKLNNVTVPNSVTYLGAGAFLGCQALTNFTLGSGVSQILSMTFASTKISTFVIPDTVTYIGRGAFDNVYNPGTLSISKNVTFIEDGAFSWCSFSSITVDADNPNYCSENNILYNKAKTSLLIASYTITSLTLPDTVTYIAQNAFKGGNIQTISFGVGCSLETIDDFAFEYSKLTSISLPSTVTRIGQYAFSRCTNLVTVTINEGITVIENGTFDECSELTTLNLPSTITRIDSNFVYNCRKLTTVNFAGTIAQWNAITKPLWWTGETAVTVIHCSDGDAEPFIA